MEECTIWNGLARHKEMMKESMFLGSADIRWIVEGETFDSELVFDSLGWNSRVERRLPATEFSDCYFGQETSRFFDVSFVADFGFFQSYDSNIEAVKKAVEIIISNANLLYFFQLNIRIRLQQLFIVTQELSDPSFVCAGGEPDLEDILSMSPEEDTCCASIFDFQEIFETLSSSAVSGKPDLPGDVIEVTSLNDITSVAFNTAHWHLLTDCFPANCGKEFCTVGLSVLKAATNAARTLVCEFSSGNNVGVSSRTFQTWLTFSHELGHNLGASHSFEEGQGTTGGLMDAGDGKIEGQYQFNDLRKNEVCLSFSELVLRDTCNEISVNHFEALDESACENQEEFFRPNNNCGICIDGECQPVQLMLKVNNETIQANASQGNPELFSHEFIGEPAEFSPIFLGNETITTGTLYLANPIRACSDIDNVDDGIVLIERGGCTFKTKVQNAKNAGAAAVIIYNNERGDPPFPMGGEGFIDIPAMAISRQSANEIINLYNSSTWGLVGAVGGFSASDKNFEELSISLFEEYRILIVAFLGMSLPLLFLYFLVTYRADVLKILNKCYEEVDYVAAELKYKFLIFIDFYWIRIKLVYNAYCCGKKKKKDSMESDSSKDESSAFSFSFRSFVQWTSTRSPKWLKHIFSFMVSLNTHDN